MIRLRFLLSPVAFCGESEVEAVKVVRNRLALDRSGAVAALPTETFETIPCGLVLRSVGYRGLPLAGLPFDERRAVVPNQQGRVAGPGGAPLPGVYCTGWIKRGPSGIIGTNKKDAAETVEALLADARARTAARRRRALAGSDRPPARSAGRPGRRLRRLAPDRRGRARTWRERGPATGQAHELGGAARGRGPQPGLPSDRLPGAMSGGGDPALGLSDPEVARLVELEFERQSQTLCLIPSENHVSRAVLEAMGTAFTNKYSEGYPGRRYYEGQQVVDLLEPLAIERARRLFGVEHVNVQPYSGSPANLALYLAFLEPGDTVMGMALPMGGHLTHGWSVSATGKWFRAVQYGVRRESGRVDLDEVRELALAERPKLIFCGGTAIPRTIEFAGFAAIAREVDAVLVADIAHIAGLIAGGRAPLPGRPCRRDLDHDPQDAARAARGDADVRRGACLGDRPGSLPRAAGRAPQPHHRRDRRCPPRGATARLRRVCATRSSRNAAALADGLLERGFELVSGGTDNHLLLIDLSSKGVPGKVAAQALDRAALTVNYNTVPYDPRKPFDPSGIRLGTPALTTRGLGEAEMAPLARWIDEAIEAARREDEGELERIGAEVRELAAAFPIPGFALPGTERP